MNNKRTVYLDHGASTPVDRDVLLAMLPYWSEQYGNPSSIHSYGRSAERALEQARQTIADLMQAQSDEIVFTGCGSESDNLALRGAMWAARANASGNHIIVSAIEHSAILNTAIQLRDQFGFDLTILPVDENGHVHLDALRTAIRPDTVLISIMAANNEIGTIQPIAAIGTIAREQGVLFHTDAIQLVALRHWDMTTMPVDLLSIAPHKFYGPKGIGMLYVRQGIELISPLTGGGQENGLRAGTSNVAYAVGAAASFRLAMEQRETRNAHYQHLRDRLIDGLLDAFPDDCLLTGHPTERLAHNASFAFRSVSGNDLLIHLDMAGIAASSGSACKTGDPKPSRTLEALGLGREWTKGGLRLTVGTQNTSEDIEYALDHIVKAVQQLQKLAISY